MQRNEGIVVENLGARIKILVQLREKHAASVVRKITLEVFVAASLWAKESKLLKSIAIESKL